MFIRVRNPDLYRRWIAWLTSQQGLQQSTAAIRTEAFIRSERGEEYR
jgi:hypothetical protein